MYHFPNTRFPGGIFMVNVFFSNNIFLNEDYLVKLYPPQYFEPDKSFILWEKLSYGNLNDRLLFFDELIKNSSSTFFTYDDVKTAINNNSLNIKKIADEIKKGEVINLYLNPNSPNDICLLSYFSYELIKTYKINEAKIIVHHLPYLVKTSDKSYALDFSWLDIFSNSKLDSIPSEEHNLIFLQIYSEFWYKLKRLKSNLRLLINNHITSTDENALDIYIKDALDSLTTSNASIQDLTRNVHFQLRDKLGMDEFFYEGRIKQIKNLKY